MSTSQAPSTTASATEDEYVRLKLELAAKRASVDTVRLQARQLISKRDGVSCDVVIIFSSLLCLLNEISWQYNICIINNLAA